MTDQASLFDERPDWMRTGKGEAWAEFHKAQPWVYEQLVVLARRYQASNATERCGIKMLWEYLRYEALTSDDMIRLGSVPALDNDLTAYYARFLMMHEEFAGMFEIRALRAA